ncbi:5696_t:CDS:2 [Cetraspora pellucida]|uniref:5696_t:CDS:1 n=1 Tax=Cetraspora pellucida TaxID=1433469 RepID=A0A9N9BD43_9GLOM|nr:5696_t:CDS:2 [Cetraspora pellucida]
MMDIDMNQDETLDETLDEMTDEINVMEMECNEFIQDIQRYFIISMNVYVGYLVR